MKCENTKCNNDLTSQQEKSGCRFCCRSCSNSGAPRLGKESSRRKVSVALKGLDRKDPTYREERKCPVCSKTFIVDCVRTERKTCSYACGKKLGAKIGAINKTARGTHSGWHNRRGEPSYPEKYFISLFEAEDITGWTRELKVGRWFIDFAFEGRKLAVEIDGRQHQDPERRAIDAKKDEHLKSLGWRVVRIPWSNPRTEKGKNALYPHITDLLGVLR